MERKTLQTQKREKTGDDTRKLRHLGIIPGVVYGPVTQAFNVQMQEHDLMQILKHGEGEAELIDLSIEGEDKPRVVLLKEVQVDPVSNSAIHVDFFEVDLNSPIDVTVSLEFIGEVKAVEEKLAVLLHIMQELPIRVLPLMIPTHIEVDVSVLSEIGNHLTIADIKLPEGVEVRVPDQSELIVKVDEIKVEVEAPAETEEVAAEGAAITDEAAKEGATETPTPAKK